MWILQEAGLAQVFGMYYYLEDLLGSVDVITDVSGSIVQKYQYSSFGKIMNILDGNNNVITSAPKISTSFTYTGREFDAESGLYYYRARVYDANIGRFLQLDPHPGRTSRPTSIHNKFIYSFNNPIQYRDPSGKDPWSDFLGVVGIAATVVATIFGGPVAGGAVAGAFIGMIDNAQNVGNWLSQVGQGAIAGALFGATFGVSELGGAISLSVSMAKAGAEGGNFIHNFNAHGVHDGALSFIGSALYADIDTISQAPIIGNLYTGAKSIADTTLTAATVYSSIDLYNVECDSTKQGLYSTNPGLCIGR